MRKVLDKFRGYALAVLLCAIALPIALHFDIPSSCFLLAAMASSLFGGRRPGLLAVGLLSLAFDFFFLAPGFHLAISQGSFVRFATFIGAMVLATELIDAKRRSDLARLQRDKDFRALAETCPDCIVLIDQKQTIQFANPAITKMFGYSIEEVVGKPSSYLLPELSEEQTVAGEFSAFRKDGQRFDVEATCGRFGGKTTIFLRDISDRKRAQRRLEESEENLRLTLDSIPGLVYSRSADGEIEYVNKHATEFFGRTLQELRAGAWTETLHPDEKNFILDAISQSFAKGQPSTMEYRRRRFDGIYRWFQTTVQPLKNRDGEVVRWYGLLTDIDDRRNAEESLRRTQAKLSQAAQIATASELAASIIHEISQPLSAMVANGQACLRWLSGTPPNLIDGTVAVERIVRDGKDARDIISGLRTLFRRSSPLKTPLDLRQIIDEVVVLIHSRAERERIAVDVRVPGNLPEVIGDRIQLQQVLLNLVSNAIESMQTVVDKQKRLVIHSQQQGDVVLTEVEDHGIGISDFDKVFDTFFTTKENGMGMGLSICRSIIEAHDGKLWGVSGTTEGSVFAFTVPHRGSTPKGS
jgi:PAS domain S-box-containing protein